MAMQAFAALKYNDARLVLLVTDRTDLDQNLYSVTSDFILKNASPAQVIQCKTGRDVQASLSRLEVEKKTRMVLTVTLQTFPHIKHPLSEQLRQRNGCYLTVPAFVSAECAGWARVKEGIMLHFGIICLQ